jgi:hypothetical protein
VKAITPPTSPLRDRGGAAVASVSVAVGGIGERVGEGVAVVLGDVDATVAAASVSVGGTGVAVRVAGVWPQLATGINRISTVTNQAQRLGMALPPHSVSMGPTIIVRAWYSGMDQV